MSRKSESAIRAREAKRREPVKPVRSRSKKAAEPVVEPVVEQAPE